MAILESWDFVTNANVIGEVLGTTITVSNTAPGTYRNASGVLTSGSASTPRIDYDGDGNCLGLLIEESMTQRGGGASQIDFTSGWVPGSCTVTSNQYDGPDGGSSNADEIADLNDATSDLPLIQASPVVSASVRYVMSVFLKRIAGNNWAYLQLGNQSTSTGRAWFDLANGVAGSTDVGMIASGIEKYANGWYRCWCALDTSNSILLCNIGLTDSDGGAHYNSNGSIIAVQYFQLEAPPPNTDASCRPTSFRNGSRNADVTSFQNCSWYDDGLNTGNFSFYTEFDCQGDANPYAFYFRAPTDSSCVISGGWQTGTTFRWSMLNNPGNDGLVQSGTLQNDGSIDRIAGACTNGDQRISVNGAAVVQDATFDYPLSDVCSTATIKYMGQSNAANSQLNGHMRHLVFADDMWDDTTLVDYTTNGYAAGSSAFPGNIAGDGGVMWPPRANDPRWTQLLTDSGISQSGNFMDDVKAALIALSGASGGSLDDLWKKTLAANAVTDISEPYLY